jgi:lysophospholipase L1-like esterase
MHAVSLARPRKLATVLLAAVGILAATAVTPAMAAGGSPQGGPHSGPSYLALGDSVPFGYHNATDPTVYANPANLVGYPELLATETHLRLANASCPGETSSSFIDATTDVYTCEGPAGYRTNYPLHVAYGGSQLDYAVHYLRTTRDVRLVTLQIGANDVFACQSRTTDQCSSAAELQAVLATVHQNIETIVTTLRAQGHYTGPIVVVDYYALDYADQPTAQATAALDQAIDGAALDRGARFASGFLAYAPIAFAQGGGDSRAAGLVRPAPDVHPTPLGQEVLEDAVQAVIGH